MAYLVTGGAGFIGSHLVDRLIKDGEKVFVLDDLSTGSRANLEHNASSALLEFVEGSTSDIDLVRELTAKVDTVFHLASAVGVQLVCDRPLDSLLANIHGCENVITAASDMGVRLVFSSTSEIYGKNSNVALAEDSDRVLGPLSKSRWSYALAKSFGEMLCYELARTHGARMAVVRLFNTVGPRQTGRYGMVLPTFVRQAVDGDDVTVYGDGSQSRCFIHVFDTVDALAKVANADAAYGRALNVGARTPITIAELAKKVIEHAGSDSQISFVPYEDAYSTGFEELGSRQPDTTAIEAEIEWRPTLTIGEMIEDTIAYQRCHPAMTVAA